MSHIKFLDLISVKLFKISDLNEVSAMTKLANKFKLLGFTQEPLENFRSKSLLNLCVRGGVLNALGGSQAV